MPFLLNLIDTPGHVDFSFEVTRSVAACEGALLLVDNQGVQAQTLATYHQALRYGVQIIPVLTKCDVSTPAEIQERALELAILLGKC